MVFIDLTKHVPRGRRKVSKRSLIELIQVLAVWPRDSWYNDLAGRLDVLRIRTSRDQW